MGNELPILQLINSFTHLLIYARSNNGFSLGGCGGVCKCNWKKELYVVLCGLCVSVVNHGFGGREGWD